MCKKLLTLILILGVLVSSPALVLAADSITETPNVKIVIDGKLGTYDDVPLTVNGRTMLPLRALLTNLGVPDDDAHILWNEAEQSVTVNNDGTKIYLKVGSSTAYLNDAPVTLDAEPIKYSKNNRVYIPARFVAQALGKKVIWNEATFAVIIAEEAKYNAVKDLLARSDAAILAASKYKYFMDLTLSLSMENKTFDMKANAAAELDKQKKAMHMNTTTDMMGMSMNEEMYYDGNIVYSNEPMSDIWSKSTLSEEEYSSVFNSNSGLGGLGENDVIFASLSIVDSSNPDEIVLRGDVYIDELLDSMMDSIAQGGENIEIEYEKFNVEIILNKNTYLINEMNMSIDGNVSEGTDRATLNAQFNVTFSDYNGDFEITVPQEVKDKAVEAQG